LKLQKSGSKIVKPIKADGNQKRNSDLLLEINNKTQNHRKSLSNSSREIANPFSSSKKNSIKRENSNSSSKNYLSEKNSLPRKSLKDEMNKVINADLSEILKEDNNKNSDSKSLCFNNTNFSNNSNNNKTAGENFSNPEINIPDTKENKFKSKGLERILNSSRK